MLTKIMPSIAVQHHCTLQLGTAILMLSVIWHLVEVGADQDQADNQGATPLCIAAHNGHLDVVRHLVEVGADTDQADNQGATPLCLAANKGHLDVVRYLVEVGADKDHAQNQGATPSYIAAENGQLDVVHHLVEVGADKDQAENQGARTVSWSKLKPRNSAASLCRQFGHEGGADIKRRGKHQLL